MERFGGTFWWNILVDVLVGHFGGTFWWNILVEHVGVIFRWNI